MSISNKTAGLILINKPYEISSFQVVKKIKQTTGVKVGHTGTLDPLATGMLILCLGQATRFSSYLLNADKSYDTTVLLGTITDTGDMEGKIIKKTEPKTNISTTNISDVLKKFTGEIQQTPPMFSALKHNGQPLYKLAREGISIDRKARSVTIKSIELKKYDAGLRELSIKVVCSKGTYIRTLAEDIGNALGCGGCVKTLHRNWIEPFQDYEMHDLNKVLIDQETLKTYITPIDKLFIRLESINLNALQSKQFQHGQLISIKHSLAENTNIAIYNDKHVFIGISQVYHDNRLKPVKVIQHSLI